MGYGDVHAVGQLARVVVIIQMAFNIVILATGASLLVNQLSDRVRRRRRPAAAGPPAPPGPPASAAPSGPDPDPRP